MFKDFLSIFMSRFPDRFACLVIIIGIFCTGSYAYDTVGLPIQPATATVTGTESANASAISWVSTQKCFGDRIRPETIVTDIHNAGNGDYSVTINFESLKYKVEPVTGSLHHVPVEHTVDMLVSRGKVSSAYENGRDLINDQVYGPAIDVTLEYL